MKFIIVTGISGAGKSFAAKHMEDMGYFCVDNLPPSLIPKFVEICRQSTNDFENVVLVIDTRSGGMQKDLFIQLDEIKKAGYKYEIFFMEASDDSIIRRFKENRRVHPLAHDGRIQEGLKKEREILKKIKDKSDYIIDTTNLTLGQLKEELIVILDDKKHFDGIIISIVSFGFKYGVPIDSDLIFDVRFLPNPYYIDILKKLTGKDKKVEDYVMGFEVTNKFIEKLIDMLTFLIPNYKKEGKSQLFIGIGCTGGRHRSVAIAERVSKILKKRGHRIILEHSDVKK